MIRAQYPPATASVQIDNDLVHVVRWHFPPGTATVWHKHGRDYVVVPTLSGTLTIIDPQGGRNAYAMHAGESYFRAAGVEHNVANLSAEAVEFVEIELKAVHE